mmetsp:Transcript_85744/g.239759  ORF Transcript_85744/g.239759 Transcript_85744/m.239759 type:complete len:683 (-) Transcript_85744:163-2211(-)
MAGKCTCIGFVFVIVSQIALTIFAIKNCIAMRSEWLEKMPNNIDVDILLVLMHDFWGPVYAIIPKDCDEIARWANRAEHHALPEGDSGHGADKVSDQKHQKKHLKKQSPPTPTPAKRPTHGQQVTKTPTRRLTVVGVEPARSTTLQPSPVPTRAPTLKRTHAPTFTPTQQTMIPTMVPTMPPSLEPTLTREPTLTPTRGPTEASREAHDAARTVGGLAADAGDVVDTAAKHAEEAQESSEQKKATHRPTSLASRRPTASPTWTPTLMPTPLPSPMSKATTRTSTSTTTTTRGVRISASTTTTFTTTTRFVGVFPKAIHANDVQDELWNSLHTARGSTDRRLARAVAEASESQDLAIVSRTASEAHAEHKDVPQTDNINLRVGSEQRFMEALFPWTGIKHRGTIEVKRCGKVTTFHQPHVYNRYLSMMTLQRLLIKGDLKLGQLRRMRKFGFRGIIVAIFVCMALKYGTKTVDIFSRIFGHQYMQVWNKSRTQFDRILESSIVHGLSIVFTLSLQITLCTCYFTFWKENHFVMSFLPGIGLIMVFVSITAVSILSVVDRCCGLMMSCSSRGVVVFWATFILWAMLLTIPMLGYAVFSIQYMIEVLDSGLIEASAGVMSEQFKTAALSSLGICTGFIVVAILDIIIIIRLDMERLGHSSSVTPDVHPLGPSFSGSLGHVGREVG